MKNETHEETITTITLNEKEKEWLKKLLRNYIKGNEESRENFKMRRALFDALSGEEDPV